MLQLRQSYPDKVQEFSLFKIYALSVLANICDGTFWGIVSVGTILKTGKQMEEAAILLLIALLFIGIFDILSSSIDKYISRKNQILIGMSSLVLGSSNLIFNSGVHISISYILFGLGMATINGSLQAWLLDLKYTFNINIGDTQFYGKIGYCRRAAQLFSAASVIFFSYDVNLPWLMLSVTGSLFLILAFPTVNKIKFPQVGNDNQTNVSKLIVFYIAQIFYGVELGIRALIFSPFVLICLTENSYSLLSLKGFSQALAGFAGNKIYMKIVQKYAKNKHYWLSLALIIYALFEFVSYYTYNLSSWICIQVVAIISMGWYFPMTDALVRQYCSRRDLALALSLKSGIAYIAAAATLFLLSNKIHLNNLRNWFPLAGTALVISAAVLLFNSKKD